MIRNHNKYRMKGGYNSFVSYFFGVEYGVEDNIQKVLLQINSESKKFILLRNGRLFSLLFQNTHFRLRNGTFDSSHLLTLLNKFQFTSSSYWLLRNLVTRKKDNLELNCVEFLVKVDRIREKSQGKHSLKDGPVSKMSDF